MSSACYYRSSLFWSASDFDAAELGTSVDEDSEVGEADGVEVRFDPGTSDAGDVAPE